MKTISLVNFTNNLEDYWNRGKKSPVVQRDIIIRLQIQKNPKCVYAASPDYNFGRPVMLDFTIEDSDRGKVMTVKIQELFIWDLIVIDFDA